MPDRWQSRLRIQSEPEAAHNANLFRQTLFADQHHDYGHLYIRMCCKRVGKIRVHRVDRERRCVRQQVVMLILQLRFIRRRQISLGKKNLRNGWAAVGVSWEAKTSMGLACCIAKGVWSGACGGGASTSWALTWRFNANRPSSSALINPRAFLPLRRERILFFDFIFRCWPAPFIIQVEKQGKI